MDRRAVPDHRRRRCRGGRRDHRARCGGGSRGTLTDPTVSSPSPAAGIAAPFAPGEVTLLPGPCADALARNQRYLHSLPTDRLLHTFRVDCGTDLDCATGWRLGKARLRTARPFQRPLSVGLRASCTRTPATTIWSGARREMSAALAACQTKIGNGYLGAYPEELYDRLKAGRPVLGAVLHVPQDPGGSPGSLHAHRQYRRTCGSRGHGALGASLAERRQRRAAAAHPADRVRRHERGALQPRRRDEEGGIPRARSSLRAAQLLRPARRSSR